jgi:hypothetical protein
VAHVANVKYAQLYKRWIRMASSRPRGLIRASRVTPRRSRASSPCSASPEPPAIVEPLFAIAAAAARHGRARAPSRRAARDPLRSRSAVPPPGPARAARDRRAVALAPLALVKRWRLGQAVAAERQRRLLAEEGPRPAQAVAESLSALNALEAMGPWPGPRDEISELGVGASPPPLGEGSKRAKRQAQARQR